jgi:SOS response associated peptidase (SRAP)
MERRAEPGPAGNPAQPQDRRGITRFAALGPHSLLVPGPAGRAETDQRQMRDRPQSADIPGRLSSAALYTPGRWLLRVESDQGARAKQPYAIAMKDGRPFGIGGLWENWKDPTSGEWMRTFAIITTDANKLVAEIHDRMPLILAPTDSRIAQH